MRVRADAFRTLQRVYTNRSLVVIDPEQGSVVGELGVGDLLSFFRLNSHAPQGEVVLAAPPVRESDPELVAAAQAAPATMNRPPYDAGIVSSIHFTAADVWRLEFDAPLPPSVQPYWSLGQCRAKGDFGGSVVNSSFHDGYARVAMLKASGTRA